MTRQAAEERRRERAEVAEARAAVARDRAAHDAKTEILISAPLNRKNAAWVGGSRLASCNTFHRMTIKQQEYQEVSPEAEKNSCILKKTIY